MDREDRREPQARQLLAAIAGGDDASLEEFYELFHNTVYAFARARLGDPHAAADILNEVMLAVWRTAGRFEGRSKVQTWLLGITHNKVVDALRSRGRHSHGELDERMTDVSADMGERIVAAAQYREAVARCLRELSDRHRQVVHLAFFEDLPYTEIARILDCPPGTVKTRMYHARLSLRRCLQHLGPGGGQGQ